MSGYVIGVDVGTASVRAGLFTLEGEMKAHATRAIDVHRDGDLAEQSSAQIWERTGEVVREIVAAIGCAPGEVIGISYDATCSLVVLDTGGRGISVSPDNDPDRDIVMWMDHRATEIADDINRKGHDVLQYVGGVMSPEQEPPKLRWLKEHFPDRWSRVGKFFDLADFMTWKSSGVDVRSLCTNVCKWTYLGHEQRWDRTFFELHGIADIFDHGRVGTDIRPMGEPIGPLTADAARHLGLSTQTMVGVGIIDAHAGGLGVMGSAFQDASDTALERLEPVLALIGGTSSCHMAVSQQPRYVNGVWGPYFSAMIPGMWLTEGGQSATGSLVDHVIRNNALGDKLPAMAGDEGIDVYQLLNREVSRLQEQNGGPAATRHLHVLPYYHGNRSPRANPHLRGTVEGLPLDASLPEVARLYYAHVQAIAYGTRHIIQAMAKTGYRITRIHACGGGTKNPVWMQEHADITGCDIHLPQEPEAVLLGSAILAAVAAGKHATIPQAMQRMCHSGGVIHANPAHRAYHDAKYQVFLDLYECQQKHRAVMDGV